MSTDDALELGGLPGAPPPPKPTPRTTPVMRPGDVVLLEMTGPNGDKWSFVNLKRDQCVPPPAPRAFAPRAVPIPEPPPPPLPARLTRPVSPSRRRTACIGKHRAVSLDPLIDAPFGSCYEVNQDGILYPAERDPVGEWHSAKPVDDHRSNKSIVDHKDQRAQALSHDDIARMKAQGAHAEDIVDKLCENSATFESKTAFAQEKYRKKKLMKHLTRVRARAPSARATCEAYFYKQPAATNWMRHDALGMLLALGNVGANAQPLIVETCGGLVVAAAAERCGGAGAGRVVAGHTGKKCNSLDITRLMNLTDEARASILTAPLAALTRARKMSDEEAEAEAAAEAKAKEDAEKANDDAEEAKEDAENANKDADEASQHRRERPEGWRPKRLAAASAADARRLTRSSEGFTSLIMAAPALEPASALREVLPLLAPSAPFAVWSYAAQPLAEALDHLRKTHAAVNVSLHEPWLRKYQVLPGRTHPTMTTAAGAGGYVLSGNWIPPEGRTGKRKAEREDDATGKEEKEEETAADEDEVDAKRARAETSE